MDYFKNQMFRFSLSDDWHQNDEPSTFRPSQEWLDGLYQLNHERERERLVELCKSEEKKRELLCQEHKREIFNIKREKLRLQHEILRCKEEKNLLEAQAISLQKNDLSSEKVQIPSKVVATEAEDRSCVVCMDHERDALFMPCQHLAMCFNCSAALEKCPICQQKIENRIKCIVS